MRLNDYIIQILKCTKSIENPIVNKQLTGIRNLYKLILDKKNFIAIDGNSIKINNHNIEKKILLTDKHINNAVDIIKINNFISKITSSIIGINHFGISYSCKNIEKELSYYKKLVSGTSLKVFEEKSDSKYNRWFFIGNLEYKENPLFEVVLSESLTPLFNEWVPHFQIDLNTCLDHETILNITKSLLIEDFIQWKLDIPNYGIVLSMGSLGSIDGTKIVLGIGTSHRGKQTLKEV